MGCSKLDDMEQEYNPVLNGGALHACSSVQKHWETRRIPLWKVSNLNPIWADNKITGVEAAMNSISRALLKRIDPKTQVKGASIKEGEVVPNMDP